MHEIICPHCSTAFKVDEAGYADILKQVRDKTFTEEIHKQLELAEKEKQTAVALAKSQTAYEMQQTLADRDAAIKALHARLDATTTEQKLAVSEALKAVEQERDRLRHALEKVKDEQLAASQLAKATLDAELQRERSGKESEIQKLKSELEKAETERKLAVAEAKGTLEKERDQLKNELQQSKLTSELSERSLKERYEAQLKDREAELERVRDMKARLSTKWSAKLWSSTARFRSIRYGRPLFPTRILRRTTMPAPAVKATLFFVIRMKRVQRSFPSCSR